MNGSKTLNELCKQFHVTRRAVQGYEKAGLVQPSSKTKYGSLLYDEIAQRKIILIHFYQMMGFSIKEIVELNSCSKTDLEEKMIHQMTELKHRKEALEDVIEKAQKVIENLNDENSIYQIILERK